MPWGARGLVMCVLLGIGVPTGAAWAQGGTTTAEQRLRQQQDELEKLRRERADLESRMLQLQRSARSLADEVNNIEAQRSTTARLVKALDQQLTTITREVATASAGLSRAEQEIVNKRTRAPAAHGGHLQTRPAVRRRSTAVGTIVCGTGGALQVSARPRTP
jgi:septal ring factor EnvC (AmiA/AmiB activator)